ncbi:TOBE domain-containing protein [Spectribacter hydrogenooxidans]|uniref:TOBE domain-containing protein n=1 Tax=Spectribacter hydrogenoxidans TaxID=3075608 RepID=A0ABU3BW43_9GAMM|nr:TOBE domain-containing protein [Salinisphaera sp. W335]MDT0633510.1 TOBE domain-containing protein [Salinisphaera sp. W335]
MQDATAALIAPIVLQLGGQSISARRLALLEGIAATESIRGAARHVGMTYKGAWDAIDAINNLAGETLVQTRQGGRQGGGASLTTAGQTLLASQRRFAAAIDDIRRQFSDEDHEQWSTLGRLLMKTSARNVLRGEVSDVRTGAVNSEVTLALPGGDRLVAIVTRDSEADLALAPGKSAWALIKASWPILVPGDEPARTSARNRLCGTIERIHDGAVNAEVVLALSGGTRLTVIVTEGSRQSLGLAEGDRACALIKTSHIILGVDE